LERSVKPEKKMKRIGLVVVRDSLGRILLLKRSRTDKWKPLQWALPGGHIKFFESYPKGSLRELYEETNIKGQTPQLLQQKDGMTIWLVTHWKGEPNLKKASHGFEHERFAWCYPEDVLLNPKVVAELRNWDLLMTL
jgi:8-oxo-dGTP pyrophosphatase MutT (NUDIX family)